MSSINDEETDDTGDLQLLSFTGVAKDPTQ
jgi:hypothetical protein